jgi:hypothetical protein
MIGVFFKTSRLYCSMFNVYGIYKGTVKAVGKVKHVASELLE